MHSIPSMQFKININLSKIEKKEKWVNFTCIVKLYSIRYNMCFGEICIIFHKKILLFLKKSLTQLFTQYTQNLKII